MEPREFVGSDGVEVVIDFEADGDPVNTVMVAWGAEEIDPNRQGERTFLLKPGADAATFERAMAWAMPDGTAADSTFLLGIDNRMTVTMFPD